MGKKYIIELLDDCRSEFKGIIAFGVTPDGQIAVELIPNEELTPYTEPDLEHEKEEQIQVGDEVITGAGKAVVIGVGPVHFEYVYADGSTGYDKVENAKKTGRHFHEIAEVLAKMKEA